VTNAIPITASCAAGILSRFMTRLFPVPGQGHRKACRPCD
jgi:hypothetical protein